MQPSRKSPYETIWLSPRRTFLEIRERGPDQPLLILPWILLSVIVAIEFVSRTQPILSINYLWMVVGASTIGLFMILLFSAGVQPWFIVMIGRFFAGQASLREIANVLAVATIPMSTLLTYQLAVFAAGGIPALFNFEGAPFLQLWTLGLVVFGVSICQRVGIGLALVNVLLANMPFFLLGLILR